MTPKRDAALRALYKRGRTTKRKLWLLDAKGHATTDEAKAVLGCYEGDAEWVRIPVPADMIPVETKQQRFV